MTKKKNEYIETMIDNFKETFTNADNEDEADVVYDMAKLREFFNIGFSEKHDELQQIIAILNNAGFQMKLSFDQQPAIFLKYIHKRIVYEECSLDNEFDNYIEELPEKPILAKFPNSLETL